MEAFENIQLDAEQLMRLNLEGNVNDYWSDIDGNISIRKSKQGVYEQIVYDDAGNEIIIGIFLNTVGELMMRFKSLVGYDLKYWDKDYPQTAQ